MEYLHICVKTTDLFRDVVSDVDLLVVQKHTVDSLDSSLSGLCSLVMDETVALGATLFVRRDLAGQNVAERGKSIVEGLVIDGLVQVLDEDVALTRLAEGWVTLGPHDTAVMYCVSGCHIKQHKTYSPSTVFNDRIVELLESPLAVSDV